MIAHKHMPDDTTNTSNTFVDTVCKTSSFAEHLMDEKCHYNEIIQLLNKSSTCTTIFPLPFGADMKVHAATPPPIFRITNYVERLKSLGCQQVYDQYTVKAIHEAIASGNLMKPKYTISPMNTSIQFFSPTFVTKYPIIQNVAPFAPRINIQYTYSISNDMVNIVKHTAMPTNFNWMDNVDITRPTDQGTCGSCWAVAASTALSDVFVASKRMSNPNISAGYILSCYPQQQCAGGNPFLAIRDMELHGARTTDCIPNTLPIEKCKCHKEGPAYYPDETRAICIPPNLSTYTQDEAEVIQSYLNSLYGTDKTADLSKETPETIQQIIKHHMYTHGPVITGFHVFKNFMKGDFRETNDVYIETETYQGVEGVDYSQLDRDWIGSHAVVIVGWGEIPIKGVNVPYWICRNSWGELWGDRGLFRIAMYGTTPFHNRVSQFEYPSLIVSDNGYGVCGGVLLLKAGRIQNPVKETINVSYVSTHHKRRFILLLFLIVMGITILMTTIITTLSIQALLIIIILYAVLLLFYFIR